MGHVSITTVTRELSTEGQGDVRDVTADVAEALAESGLTHGIVTTFVVGSTAAVTTIEFEPGAVEISAVRSSKSRPVMQTINITCSGATTTGRAMCVRPCSDRR